MGLQVLVSSLNQNVYSILKNMRIQTDAIIINQCERTEWIKLEHNGSIINFYSFNERGVGLSRNNALMRATASICLFADEDMTYVEGYEKIVCDAFKKNPDADLIVFNVPSMNPERPTYNILKSARVRWFNCLKYGAVSIAIRTEKVRQANVNFSLLFGGGAKYSAGEDSLFIVECLRKGLKVFTNTAVIGHVKQDNSTWFEGYTDKYFIDKGVFFSFVSRRLAGILSLHYAIRYRKKFKGIKSWREIYLLMKIGIREIDR
ncbi:glycosyltransferase family A protein [Cohnella sp. 56]|uniref:glycosyltransferase family A protein n=1 Tax=Cohnella sp. 56 TaxID=3113722 RepID=UPI0030EA1D58